MLRDHDSGQMRTFHIRFVRESSGNLTGRVDIPPVILSKSGSSDYHAGMRTGNPICLARWYHANDVQSPERIADSAWRDTPEAERPDVHTIVATNRREFENGIRGWFDANENTQYLVTASHGILDDSGVAVGIGSVAQGQETIPPKR